MSCFTLNRALCRVLGKGQQAALAVRWLMPSVCGGVRCAVDSSCAKLCTAPYSFQGCGRVGSRSARSVRDVLLERPGVGSQICKSTSRAVTRSGRYSSRTTWIRDRSFREPSPTMGSWCLPPSAATCSAFRHVPHRPSEAPLGCTTQAFGLCQAAQSPHARLFSPCQALHSAVDPQVSLLPGV